MVGFHMIGLVAGIWGLFGGFAVEGLELYGALRRHGRWPWKPQPGRDASEIPEAGLAGYLIAEGIRLFIGAGLAWAAAATGQIAGPLGALGVGVAAPTIIGQLAKAIPLSSPEWRPSPRPQAVASPDLTKGEKGKNVYIADTGAATEVAE